MWQGLPTGETVREQMFLYTEIGKELVAIGYLERFAADFERETGNISIPEIAPPNGIKIAVVGSGPAGLAFAGDMIKLGYDVTVFEALHELGGVLRYGIPEFRLPNDIVEVEIEVLKRWESSSSPTASLAKPSPRGVESRRLPGHFHWQRCRIAQLHEYSWRESQRCNVMQRIPHTGKPDAGCRSRKRHPVQMGKRVAVIGGGNTAMDAVRTARRLGAEKAMIVYRRSEAEMPARVEEVKHAKEEGIEFLTLHNPIRYEGMRRGACNGCCCSG